MLRGSKGRYPYHDGKHLIVAVELFAYLDECGIQADAPICLIAGYIASPRQWMLFEADWQATLREYCVEEFKTSRFFARNREGERVSEYRGWGDDKARAFLGRLVSAILSRRIASLGIGVERSGFDALSVGERRLLTGGIYRHWPASDTGQWKRITGAPSKPYHFLMDVVMKQALSAADDPNTVVHFVFDQQKEFSEQALRWFRVVTKEKQFKDVALTGELRFADSKQQMAVQAADLYGGLVYRNLVRGSTAEQAAGLAPLIAKPAVGMKRAGAFPVFAYDDLRDFMDKHFPAGPLAQIRAMKS